MNDSSYIWLQLTEKLKEHPKFSVDETLYQEMFK